MPSSPFGHGWSSVRYTGAEADAFDGLVGALRTAQDNTAGARPPIEVANECAELLSAVAAKLAPYQVDEDSQYFGHLEAEGSGQSMRPVLAVDELTDTDIRGRVTVTRFFLGAGGAAHGGILALLFDTWLGQLANRNQTPARTAFLHVDFQAIAPLDTEVILYGRVDRVEGRKRFVSGRLSYGDTVCCTVTALFVEMRPGQP